MREVGDSAWAWQAFAFYCFTSNFLQSEHDEVKPIKEKKQEKKRKRDIVLKLLEEETERSETETRRPLLCFSFPFEKAELRNNPIRFFCCFFNLSYYYYYNLIISLLSLSLSLSLSHIYLLIRLLGESLLAMDQH